MEMVAVKAKKKGQNGREIAVSRRWSSCRWCCCCTVSSLLLINQRWRSECLRV
ncbi:conserved hypothetical protein [Ricinus communis]|uniref:Uncharacterized protein n=1 Tax=Ricinus communis TaxID=3988 RepID=B9RSI6_RICCO|nr:conserved hypothetical protein [Ricinus communis]